jgi:hypothetical protein
MASMTNVRIKLLPRDKADDVHLTVFGTINLTSNDVAAVGDRPVTGQYRIMDRDWPGLDDALQNGDFQIESFDVGANKFNRSITVPHSTLANSEPWHESAAELYVRVRGKRPETDWANSGEVTVPYE